MTNTPAGDTVARDRALNEAIAEGRIPGDPVAKADWERAWAENGPETVRTWLSARAPGRFNKRAPAGAARPLALSTPSAAPVERMSRWNATIRVKINPFSRNPLVDDARQAVPAVVAMASREAPVPTMFTQGDLPLVLASGASPDLLLRIPWQARHYAAEADASTLAKMLEELGDDNGDAAAMLYGGLSAAEFDYDQRVRRWLEGPAGSIQQRLS